MGSKGIVASSAAMGVLLQQGIGDTIRISLTPEPNGDRTREVQVGQELLQTMGLRTFVPLVAACPGCGRTTSTTFQELAADIQGFIRDSMPGWKTRYPGVETLNVAVMGCIVNGPGESKHADIGISLPGTGEQPTAPVFIDGKKAATLRGANADHRLQADGDRLYRAALGNNGTRGRVGRAGCASPHLRYDLDTIISPKVPHEFAQRQGRSALSARGRRLDALRDDQHRQAHADHRRRDRRRRPRKTAVQPHSGRDPSSAGGKHRDLLPRSAHHAAAASGLWPVVR